MFKALLTRAKSKVVAATLVSVFPIRQVISTLCLSARIFKIKAAFTSPSDSSFLNLRCESDRNTVSTEVKNAEKTCYGYRKKDNESRVQNT